MHVIVVEHKSWDKIESSSSIDSKVCARRSILTVVSFHSCFFSGKMGLGVYGVVWMCFEREF